MRLPENEFIFEDEPVLPLLPEGATLAKRNGADIYSASWNVAGSPEKTAEYLRREMDKLSDCIDTAEGIVGHIKAAVSRVEGQWVLSTAGTKCTQNVMHHVSTQVELVVIVFQTPKKLIADWLCEIEARLKNLPSEENSVSI